MEQVRWFDASDHRHLESVSVSEPFGKSSSTLSAPGEARRCNSTRSRMTWRKMVLGILRGHFRLGSSWGTGSAAPWKSVVSGTAGYHHGRSCFVYHHFTFVEVSYDAMSFDYNSMLQ